MKRFKSPRQVPRFLSTHDQIANAFSRRPNQDTATSFHAARTQAFITWAEITGVGLVLTRCWKSSCLGGQLRSGLLDGVVVTEAVGTIDHVIHMETPIVSIAHIAERGRHTPLARPRYDCASGRPS